MDIRKNKMNFYEVHFIFLYIIYTIPNYTIIEYKKLIVKLINSITNINKSGRKMKCSVEYYVDRILYIFKTGISWNNLETTNCTPNAVYKNFIKWIDEDVQRLHNP